MSYLLASLQVEGLKIFKSKIMWITVAAFTIAPLMGGFFMFVLKNPQLAESSGLIGAKASIVGDANWPSYIRLHAQIIAVGGILVFGFVTSWCFGREFAEGTAKDLLALPYSRAVTVIAKFIAVFIANILISIYVVVIGIFIGFVVGLPQWSSVVMLKGLFILIVTTILTIALSTPVAFFASYGRGYLAPLGFVVLMVVLSQIIAAVGYGEYFPWSVPALFSGVTDLENPLNWPSLFIVFLTSLIGLVSTLMWWLYADQH